jgi:hypothetical protein
MNKKLFYTVVAFACLAGTLYKCYMQDNISADFGESNPPAFSLKVVALNIENKTVILQDEDTSLTTNATSSLFSPLVVAGLGLALVASVPIALKILNHHSKKIEGKQKN